MLRKRNSEQIDIIFEAGEDLLNSQKSQVVVLKGTMIRLPITRPRTFLSYSFEFCGITGMSYKQLRFQSLGRDVRVTHIVLF
jgi:speckle-type POZ protein